MRSLDGVGVGVAWSDIAHFLGHSADVARSQKRCKECPSKITVVIINIA